MFFAMVESRSKYIRAFVVFVIVCGFSGPLWGDTKNTGSGDIVIGQSCALSGPNKLLGTEMRDGALLYFKELNSKGGINGRKVRLITYDDGYEPDRCLANTKKLIEEDKVFLLFGYVGTPTSKEALPLVIKKKIPFFAPYTGANVLRQPLKREVFNIRASYHQEAEMMVDRLVNDLGFTKISVFYQNDAYGEDGLEGVRRAMQKRKLKLYSTARYERNTTDVKEGIKAFTSSPPQAVIMIGTYSACGTLVETMRANRSDIVFLNVSFVGGYALGARLQNKGLGVIVSQVTPFPYYTKIPVVAEYKSLLNRTMPESNPSYVSMEGYLAAKALCSILKDAPALTRAAFIATAEKQTALDLGGFTVSFSPLSHQGSDLVSLTQIGPAGFMERIESLKKIREY
jgi:ABC-type branched-subunit amino acid transport system substrate-binding protein